MTKPIRLLFSGSSGSGKSALVSWSEQMFGLTKIPSQTTPVYKRYGYSPGDFDSEPAKLMYVQRKIALATANALEVAMKAEVDFVSERSFDVLVYTALMVGKVPVELERRILEVIRASVLFLVKPCPSILEMAQKTDEGRRSKFLSPEYVYRIDGALEHFLVDRGLAFFPITSPVMKDRTDTVRAVIDRVYRTKISDYPITMSPVYPDAKFYDVPTKPVNLTITEAQNGELKIVDDSLVPESIPEGDELIKEISQ